MFWPLSAFFRQKVSLFYRFTFGRGYAFTFRSGEGALVSAGEGALVSAEIKAHKKNRPFRAACLYAFYKSCNLHHVVTCGSAAFTS